MDAFPFEGLPAELQDEVRRRLEPAEYVALASTSRRNREADDGRYWRARLAEVCDLDGHVPAVSWKRDFLDIFEFLVPTSAFDRRELDLLSRGDPDDGSYVVCGRWLCHLVSDGRLARLLPWIEKRTAIFAYSIRIRLFPGVFGNLTASLSKTLREIHRTDLITIGEIGGMYRAYVSLRDRRLCSTTAFDEKLRDVWPWSYDRFSEARADPESFRGLLDLQTDSYIDRIGKRVLEESQRGRDYRSELACALAVVARVPHQKERIEKARQNVLSEAERHYEAWKRDTEAKFRELNDLLDKRENVFVVINSLPRLPRRNGFEEAYLKLFGRLMEIRRTLPYVRC